MWKYKQVVIDQNASVDRRQEVLDQLGDEGWELKTSHPCGSRQEVMVFAKQFAQESQAAPIPSGSSAKPLLG